MEPTFVAAAMHALLRVLRASAARHTSLHHVEGMSVMHAGKAISAMSAGLSPAVMLEQQAGSKALAATGGAQP